MSFTASNGGTVFSAGYFLKTDETCVRESMDIAANHSQRETRGDRTVVPAGAVIPANGATAKGILYEDIDVTNGAKPGSVVTEGTVYGDLLPATIAEAAATAMTGIKVVSYPTVTRPDFGE